MITKTKAKNLNLLFVRPSVFNKQTLINMAKNGEKRPSSYKTKMGMFLTSYTSKSSVSYDKKFHLKIKKLRPDWFVSSSSKNKQILIKMAKNGEDKPSENSMGPYLHSYLKYDKNFYSLIKKIRPDWLESKTYQKKQILINMAKNGEKRPSSYKTKIGTSLLSYTRMSSKAYDKRFCQIIKKLRPDWFVSSSDQNKKLLIAIAKSGEKRPVNKLGKLLRNYISKSSSVFDSNFTSNIKKLRPDWFRK